MSTIDPVAAGGVGSVDKARVEAFMGRMVEVVNHAFIGLLVSVGHQTHLFDVMASLPRDATSETIAEAAGLQERYVREWLAGMVTGRIVEYDAERKTYRLPPEHASCLTRAAGADNLAMFTQYIAMCALVEPKIVECFRRGGGVPYTEYPRFHDLVAEEAAMSYDTKLVSAILPLVPGLVDRLARGADVVDLGCGVGHQVTLMAEAFPRSRFTGVDFSAEGIRRAREHAARKGLSNARFETADLASFDLVNACDLVTMFDVAHDLARPDEVLRRVARALRPDGTFFMVDVAAATPLADNLDHPFAPTLYSVSLFHCMTVSLSQGGPGLGTMWGETKACELLAAAGFRDVEVKHLEGDVFHAFFIARRG